MKIDELISGEQARAWRIKLKINQRDFWETVGVGQSAGSRYERVRRIPRPVNLLLMLAHGDDSQAAATLSVLRSSRHASTYREALQGLRRHSKVNGSMRYISVGKYDAWSGASVRVPGVPQKMFSISRYGSMAKAVATAKKYRDELLKVRERRGRRMGHDQLHKADRRSA